MQTEIQIIDQQIDAVHAALVGRVKCMPQGYVGWENAWRRNPDLRARETALFRARGEAQERRDAALAKAARDERARQSREWRRAAIAKATGGA